MTLTVITDGLMKLLETNHYSPETIKFYQREWDKISRFLHDEYANEEFEMERGLAYLEKQYGFISKYNDGTISQQRVQLLRVVHMMEDYRLHQVLTRRYYASKNPIILKEDFATVHAAYCDHLLNTDLSKSTVQHYDSIAKVFLNYLEQKDITDVSQINMVCCNGYIKTLAGYGYKTVEQNICGLRSLLRYLLECGSLTEDFASKIHMPPIPKQATVPSVWTIDELKRLINVIDRNSPIGKRDYAMILLACVLGLRISDIKNLRFSNIDWNSKELSIVQQKTKKPLRLPLPDLIGWAIIDYIRYGRPKFDSSDIIFVKHMPPFDPLADSDHLQQRIIYYMNRAGIRRDKKRHSGFHSLRHSAGSMMLEMGTPLPVITTVLGHSDMDVTAIYLKTDLDKLAECVLPLEGIDHVQ
jgi:site-specific recombinase XerD